MTKEELDNLKIKYPEFKGKGRAKNLTNLRFGWLTALYRYDQKGTNGKCAQWVCQCDCGNIIICDAGRLNSKQKTNCGCQTKSLKSKNAKNNFNDLTGQTFGELKVIKHINNPDNTGALFECLCSCGNKEIVKGIALSYGQVTRCKQCAEKYRHRSKGSPVNLIGKKFGSLLVLEESEQRSSNGGVKWKCLCDCGNITYIPTFSLLSNNSTTCGAPIHKAKDLTGKKFGKLTAIKILNKQDSQGHFYGNVNANVEILFKLQLII